MLMYYMIGSGVYMVLFMVFGLPRMIRSNIKKGYIVNWEFVLCYSGVGMIGSLCWGILAIGAIFYCVCGSFGWIVANVFKYISSVIINSSLKGIPVTWKNGNVIEFNRKDYGK